MLLAQGFNLIFIVNRPLTTLLERPAHAAINKLTAALGRCLRHYECNAIVKADVLPKYGNASLLLRSDDASRTSFARSQKDGAK
jgi:hypothetical protein